LSLCSTDIASGPNDLDAVEQRLLALEKRYNAHARPFTWKFTPADLDALLVRLERHEKGAKPYNLKIMNAPTNLRSHPLSR